MSEDRKWLWYARAMAAVSLIGVASGGVGTSAYFGMVIASMMYSTSAILRALSTHPSDTQQERER